MITTLAQLEQQIDQQVTNPLYPEVFLVFAIIEHCPGAEEGGELEELYFMVHNRPGLVGDRLRAWVFSEYGSRANLHYWETVPSSRQIEAEYDEF